MQMKPPVDTDGQRKGDNTADGSGDVGDTVGSSARRQPRSHKLRELHKWSIVELEKWLRNVQRMPAGTGCGG